MIVAPQQTEVISLAPEFITPQDGSEKQDCEVGATKRWITTHTSDFVGQSITFLGDDLYSHQPMAEDCLNLGMNFIFTCLSDSHKTLYERLSKLEETGEVKALELKKSDKRTEEIYQYRYVNEISLRNTQPALSVD